MALAGWRQVEVYLLEDKVTDAAGKDTYAVDTKRMNARIWKRLPEELIDKVLLWLPPADQARCSAVCKAWRSVVTSRWFREERVSLGIGCRGPVWILGSTSRPELSTHSRQAKVDLSFLPADYRSWVFRDDPRVEATCGLIWFPHQNNICLVNLANKTWRELPRIKKWWSNVEFTRVVVSDDDFDSSFHVLASTCGLNPVVYSSVTRRWTKLAISGTDTETFGSSLVFGSVICKGVAYVIRPALPRCEADPELALFDARDGKLLAAHQLPAGLPRESVYSRCAEQFPSMLATHGGLSTHAGTVFFTALSSTGHMTIWELDSNTKDWKQVVVMPQDLLPLDFHKEGMLDVTHADGAIYIAAHSPVLHGVDRVFCYTIAKDSWSTILRRNGRKYTRGYRLLPGRVLVGQLRPDLRL